jgi:glycosyltransferase involved in cell wall biosynthesis
VGKVVIPVLSVLMASTYDRMQDFSEMAEQICIQAQRPDVEFLTIIDDRKRTLGAKCNDLVGLARGDYCVIVDDDDRVSPDFVDRIVRAASSGADCVVYAISFHVDGKFLALVHSSIYNEPSDDWVKGLLKRRPDKKMAIRREILLRHPFSDRWAGSDWRQARSMFQSLRSETLIPTPLYYHLSRSDNTDCRDQAASHGEYHNASKGMEKAEA